jgi:hypothetical protein
VKEIRAGNRVRGYLTPCQGYRARRAVTGLDIQHTLCACIPYKWHLRNDSGPIVAADVQRLTLAFEALPRRSAFQFRVAKTTRS